MSTPSLTYTAFGATDVGRLRESNQDTFLCESTAGLFAVIDGMGGYAGGERAAEIARQCIFDRIRAGGASPERLLREAIAYANNAIYTERLQTPERSQMGCVLTVVLSLGDHLQWGHVGDTRLYRLHGGAIELVTDDHSLVGALVRSGRITEAEGMRHPNRNVVLREVGGDERGPDEAEFIDTGVCAFPPEAAFLLCSDGLTDLVEADAIAGVLARHAQAPRAAAQALIDLANERGGKDNITVVVIMGPRFDGRPAPSSVAPAPPVDPPPATSSRVLRWGLLAAMSIVVIGLGVALFLWLQRPAPAPEALVPHVDPRALPLLTVLPEALGALEAGRYQLDTVRTLGVGDTLIAPFDAHTAVYLTAADRLDGPLLVRGDTVDARATVVLRGLTFEPAARRDSALQPVLAFVGGRVVLDSLRLGAGAVRLTCTDARPCQLRHRQVEGMPGWLQISGLEHSDIAPLPPGMPPRSAFAVDTLSFLP